VGVWACGYLAVRISSKAPRIPLPHLHPFNYLVEAIGHDHIFREYNPMCDGIVSTDYFIGVTRAIENVHHETVRCLLENGYVNTTETDILGITTEHGDSTIIKLALQYGAQVQMEHLLCALNGASRSTFSTVSLLIEGGLHMNEDIYSEVGNALYHDIFVACERISSISRSLELRGTSPSSQLDKAMVSTQVASRTSTRLWL
jgi:hypothetical protein